MPEPPPYPAGHGLLDGKVVVVTAAAGTGIGFATARRCAEEGALVVIGDKHERRIVEAAEQLAEVTGAPPPALACDVTVEADVQRLVDAAVDAHGRIDVTLNGTFRCTRAALRHMIPRRSGTVVNNASVLAWRAQAGQAHYAAAKAGVMALTRCAAMEAAPAGVRVNAVAPSLALHPFLSKVIDEDTLDELERREAFGRSAETWEVANVIVFLASDYSSYMTGEVVSVSSQHP